MIRKVFAFIVGVVSAFFAYCTATGEYSTQRSTGWALFYGIAAALMFTVALQGPIVHIWINTSKLRRRKR